MEDKQYEEMLEDLYKKVKPIAVATARFEIPKVQGMIEGTKTIITNFLHICSALRRDPAHVAKFLSREVAALSTIEGERLVLNRKINSAVINEKIQAYADEFVTCPQCRKPDTELVKEKAFLFIRCLACGAKHSVRAKIV
jgi:translation initiation factor 2 subunit 2